MRVVALAAFAVVLSSGLLACKSSRPTEDRCKLAVENIRNITETNRADVGARPEAMIRSCRANSTKEAVECLIAASTIEQLSACEGEVGKAYYADQEKLEREAAKKQQQDSKDGDGSESESEDTGE